MTNEVSSAYTALFVKTKIGVPHFAIGMGIVCRSLLASVSVLHAGLLRTEEDVRLGVSLSTFFLCFYSFKHPLFGWLYPWFLSHVWLWLDCLIR